MQCRPRIFSAGAAAACGLRHPRIATQRLTRILGKPKQFNMRSCGRVAEGGGLLNRYTLQRRIEGSNPSGSASLRCCAASAGKPSCFALARFAGPPPASIANRIVPKPIRRAGPRPEISCCLVQARTAQADRRSFDPNAAGTGPVRSENPFKTARNCVMGVKQGGTRMTGAVKKSSRESQARYCNYKIN
jgi:hypothetical protein